MSSRLRYLCQLTPLLLAVAVRAGFAQGEATTPQRVEIPNTELIKFTSEIVQHDYELHVQLPGAYGSEPSYPVIFVLDAQWDFPLVSAIYGQQYYDGFIPAAITVGITWGGGSTHRARDFAPSKVASEETGKAASFLAFIKKELIPFVESRYAANQDRTLMGSSLGGLFTLFAMLTETELFDRYVLTSPAHGWDNGILYKYEEDYAQKNSSLPVRLFMAQGGKEGGVTGFEKLVQRLQDRNYEDFHMETKILEGMGHSGTKAEGYARGLQFVFRRPAIKVDPEILQNYVGTYRDGARGLKITLQEQNLSVSFGGSQSQTLQAETAKDFYADGILLNIHFAEGSDKTITGLTLERYGSKQLFAKQ